MGSRVQGAGKQGMGRLEGRCKQGASKVEGTGGRSVAVQVCNVHAPFSQALGLFDSSDCLRWMRLTD